MFYVLIYRNSILPFEVRIYTSSRPKECCTKMRARRVPMCSLIYLYTSYRVFNPLFIIVIVTYSQFSNTNFLSICYLKSLFCYRDIKGVKESKTHFDKISNELDTSLIRNSQVSRMLYSNIFL